MSKESTLTTPWDRDLTNKFTLNTTAPELTPEQVAVASETLTVKVPFPNVERRYADPELLTQRIGLFSFVPSKGATPDSKGVYGFAKMRGNFATEQEAKEHADKLYRGDSYHHIFHAYVGRPFPVTLSSDFSKVVDRIDIKKEAETAIAEDVKKKREKEQKEIEEIEERERELLAESKQTEVPTDDKYTTLRVKKAQLVWTYIETKNKLEQMKGLIARARKELEEMDEKFPDLQVKYFEKYMEARRRVGHTTVITKDDPTFMKYLVEDVTIPEVEEEYQMLYGSNGNK